MENIEIGKIYKLKQDGEYFCIPLQRCVRFTSPVCVEVTHKYTVDYFDPLKKDTIYFGKLIDMSGSVDYVTENEEHFRIYSLKILMKDCKVYVVEFIVYGDSLYEFLL